MRLSINNPTIELRSLALSVDNSDNKCLEEIPILSEFVQWNMGDFEDKIYSLEQLKKDRSLY